MKLRLQVGGFVDDVHLLAYGASTETNCLTLKLAHEVCLRWANTHGATFAPKKYELVHLTRRPKRFNMKAVVDLGATVTEPKSSIRVLGLHVDGKLRWGPHLKKVRAKMTSQCLALSVTAASTWGTTLNRARTVYNAVVKPAMTYAAAIWYNPAGTRGATKAPGRQLGIVQNKCLRHVSGAYKATNTRELEAETGVHPMQTSLDLAVLRHQALRGIHDVTKVGNTRIRRALRSKRGRRTTAKEAPAEEKGEWARKALSEGGREGRDEEREKETGGKKEKIKRRVRGWGDSAWGTTWETYRSGIPESERTPAQGAEDWKSRRTLHRDLAKAESSALIQMRTGKIGFAQFLFQCRVPGVQSASCECGWPKQDVKHVLIFCPRLGQYRPALLESAGTSDLRRMLTTPEGARASTRWLIRSGLLEQYSLAREQLYGEETP